MDEKTTGAIPEENAIKGISYQQAANVPYYPLEIIEREDVTRTVMNLIDKAIAYLGSTTISRENVSNFALNAKTTGYIYNCVQVLDENNISFPRELAEVTKSLVSDLIETYGEETFKDALNKFTSMFAVVNYFGLAFYLSTGRIGEIYLNYIIKSIYQNPEYSNAFWYYIKADSLMNMQLFVDTKPQLFPLSMEFNNSSLLKTTSVIKYTSLYKPETYNPVQDSVISFSKVVQSDRKDYFGKFVIINSFASTHLTPFVPTNNPSQKSVVNLIKHFESVISKLQTAGLISKKRQEQYLCLTSYDIISNDNIVARSNITKTIEEIIYTKVLWLKEELSFPMPVFYKQ